MSLNKILLKEKVVQKVFDLAVLATIGTAIAGAIMQNPTLLYGAGAGTVVSVFAGSHYNDTRPKREMKYLL